MKTILSTSSPRTVLIDTTPVRSSTADSRDFRVVPTAIVKQNRVDAAMESRRRELRLLPKIGPVRTGSLRPLTWFTFIPCCVIIN